MLDPINSRIRTATDQIRESQNTGTTSQATTASPATSFEETLRNAEEKASALHFSKHAQERLAQRGVQLTADHLRRLQGAVDRAAAKGSRDSLVLMDDLAVVVSVRNRTVITAVDAASRKDSIFTNIDSVVLSE